VAPQWGADVHGWRYVAVMQQSLEFYGSRSPDGGSGRRVAPRHGPPAVARRHSRRKPPAADAPPPTRCSMSCPPCITLIFVRPVVHASSPSRSVSRSTTSPSPVSSCSVISFPPPAVRPCFPSPVLRAHPLPLLLVPVPLSHIPVSNVPCSATLLRLFVFWPIHSHSCCSLPIIYSVSKSSLYCSPCSSNTSCRSRFPCWSVRCGTHPVAHLDLHLVRLLISPACLLLSFKRLTVSVTFSILCVNISAPSLSPPFSTRSSGRSSCPGCSKHPHSHNRSLSIRRRLNLFLFSVSTTGHHP
jgi:hypothetical protein